MIASLRRTRTTRSQPTGRRARRGVAVAAALSLGLAACAPDDGADGEDEIEAPADDGAADDGAIDDGAAAEDEVTEGEELEQPEAAGFDTLTADEVVPGVSLDAPVDEGASQAQPTPTGSAFVGSLADQNGAVTVNVEFEGQSLDELLAGIDDLVEAGQAEVTSGPEPIEIEGADEASRVELAAPGGQAMATGIFATVDGNAISIAVEVLEGSDIDVEAIIDSIVIDADRLQVEGTLELEDAPAPADPDDPTDEATTEDDDTEG